MKKFFSEVWSHTMMLSKDPNTVIPYAIGAFLNLCVILPLLTHQPFSLVSCIFKLIISMIIMPFTIFAVLTIFYALVNTRDWVKGLRDGK